MLGVLLAAMGVAALMGRSRERRWAVELDPTPYPAGELTLRLPSGWHVDATPEDVLPRVVTSTDPSPDSMRREVQVLQIPLPRHTTPTALLDAYLSNRTGLMGDPQPFPFLGQPGVLVPFIAVRRSTSQPGAPQVAEPQWYAATVLPDAGRGQGDLGVLVALLRGRQGPSGDRVLRQVAGGLERRAPGSATRPLDSK